MFILRLLFTFCTLSTAASFWFFGSDTAKDKSNAHENTPNEARQPKELVFKHVPFEVKSVDDRLLKETYTLTQLSQLDSCFHGVMSELEGSCVSMSEEELSKLSVRLLNCQSMVEGRRIYPCTTDMELKECTIGMDETVWNSYQIVSNRARSVCYQIRHQQFRLKTELTVNKLVESSEEQLRSLREMEIGHDILKQLTVDVMKTVDEGQMALLDRQLEMNRAQEEIEQQIERNRQQLSTDHQLISMENMKLMEISEKIRDKLDNATDQISTQVRVHSERHNELMGDINHIASETKRVISTLDEGKAQVKVMREQTDEHFEEVVKNLMVINGSVAYLAELIQDTKHFVSDKLNVLSFYVNMGGRDMEILYIIAGHLLYLFGVLVVLVFFNTHSMFKLALLLLVFLNLVSHLNWGKSLTFSNLSSALMTLFLGYHLMPMNYFRRLMLGDKVKTVREYSPDSSPTKQGTGLTSDDIQKVILALERIKTKNVTLELTHEVKEDSREDEVMIPPPAVPITPSTPVRQRKPSATQLHLVVQETPKNVSRQLLRDFELQANLSKSINWSSLEGRTSTPLRNKSPSRLLEGRTLTPLRNKSPSRVSESRTSTPLRSKSPSRLSDSFLNRSVRAQCTSLTKAGAVCKLYCQEGSSYCHFHINSAE